MITENTGDTFTRTLKEFVHYDEYGREQGAGVRQKSEDLVNLLTNASFLAEARRNKTLPGWSKNTNQVPRIADYPGNSGRAIEAPPHQNESDNDQELQRAIEESKRTAAADEERRRRKQSEDGFFNNLASPKQSMNGSANGGYKTIEYITEVRALPFHESSRAQLAYQEPQRAQLQKSKSYELPPPEERKALPAPPPSENPFLNKTAQPLMLTEGNPFENELEATPNNDPFKEISNQAPMTQYNIPMPQPMTRRHTLEELAGGAKPVLPANIAPQFSANRKDPKYDPTYRPG